MLHFLKVASGVYYLAVGLEKLVKIYKDLRSKPQAPEPEQPPPHSDGSPPSSS